ncbi:MAG: hypothetical protein ACO1RX_21005 [Candidatus Sericytochromatia bacterium]
MNQFASRLLFVTALSLSACQSPATAPPAPNPSPSTSASPTPPSATPPAPVPSASVPASASPTPATPSPSASATSIASPAPTATPSVSPLANLEVKVLSDTGSAVSNAQIEISAVDSSNTFSKRLSGASVLNFSDLPANTLLLVTATAPGFNAQSQSVTLAAASSNQLVFEEGLALSEKPEIIAVEPGFPANVEVFDPIVLVFNKNMNRDSVEAALAFQNDSETNSKPLKAGNIIPAASLAARASNSVFNQSQLNLEWDGSRRLIITPKHGWPISSNPYYRLTLTYRDGNNGEITDASGKEARRARAGADGPFRIGQTYRPFLPVIVADDDLPETRLRSVTAEDNNGSDLMILRFNRELQFKLANGEQVSPGATNPSLALADSDEVTAQEAVQNYELTCNDQAVDWPSSALAAFAGSDEIRIRVSEGDNLFESGDSCELVIPNGRDVFGGAIGDRQARFTVR